MNAFEIQSYLYRRLFGVLKHDLVFVNFSKSDGVELYSCDDFQRSFSTFRGLSESRV